MAPDRRGRWLLGAVAQQRHGEYRRRARACQCPRERTAMPGTPRDHRRRENAKAAPDHRPALGQFAPTLIVVLLGRQRIVVLGQRVQGRLQRHELPLAFRVYFAAAVQFAERVTEDDRDDGERPDRNLDERAPTHPRTVKPSSRCVSHLNG